MWEKLKTYMHVGESTAWELLLAVGVAIAVALVLMFIKHRILAVLSKLADKLTTKINVLAAMVRALQGWFLFVVPFTLLTDLIELPAKPEKLMTALMVMALAAQAALVLTAIIRSSFERYVDAKKNRGDTSGISAISIGSFILQGAVWVIASLMVLDNLGVDVTTLIAGLGIGGLAVGLAAQNILSDLFSSLAIVLDRPFEVGDYIDVGEHAGTVERIGIKTTRIRSILSGELVVVSNTDLLSSRIRNYRGLPERRASFELGVTYDTPAAKLKKIPALVEKAVNSASDVRFERCHFTNYGAYSLNFSVVFWYSGTGYKPYLDELHKVNVKIFELFGKEGIEFAFPTQTVHYVNDNPVAAAKTTERSKTKKG